MMSSSQTSTARTDRPAGAKVIHVIQGEFRISGDPDAMFSTLLGSCVAACIRDPHAGLGGMNHFLLPEGPGGGGNAERYGVHAMEMLINGLLSKGADRRNLEVKLFGGAKTIKGVADVGVKNTAFARTFIESERLRIVGECLGGTRGRRLQFWPVSGRARRIFMAETEHVPVRLAPIAPAQADAGLLELF